MKSNYPIININDLFTPESNIENLLTEAANESNEFGDSLDLFMRLKVLSDYCSDAMEILKPSAIRIAGRNKEFLGIPLTIRANKTYEYDDEVIVDLRKQIKTREEWAKQAFTSNLSGIVIPETGEFVAAAKIKTASESIQIKRN